VSADSQVPEDWFDIVERVRDGDPIALAKLTGLITSLLYRQGAYERRSSWEDVCQDVLAALVRSVESGSLREPRAFVSYAYTLTRNAFLDYVQRRDRVTSGGRRDERALRESVELVEREANDVMHPDLLLDLERALEQLDRRSRSVVEEIYLRGRTYQEVADRFSMPLGTVKRLQTGGLRTLREALRQDDGVRTRLEALFVASRREVPLQKAIS